MANLEIHQFIAGQDNYCVLLHDPEAKLTVSIDSTDAGLITRELAAKGWTLTHLLITHHHADHVAGNLELKRAFGCEIVGPAGESHKIPGIDRSVRVGGCVIRTRIASG